MPLHHRRSRLLGVLVTAFLLISGLGSCSTEEDFTSDSFRNFDVLWETLDRNYCYFDLKLPKDSSWADMRLKWRSQLRAQMSSDSLFLVLTGLISELKDGHVNLITPFDQGRYWRWKTDYPAGSNSSLIEEYLGQDYRIAGALSYTWLKHHDHGQDSIGYIRVSSFAQGLSEGNINSALSRLSGCRALIIDIRDNGGGQVTNSDLLASHFIDAPRVVGYMSHKRGPRHDDFAPRVELRLRPVDRGVRWLRPVVLLVDRGVYSAANDFTLRMSRLPLVTIMGQPTGGGGGLPMSSELPNGWSVRYSASRTYDAEGRDIEQGIKPDLALSFEREAAIRGYDTMIEGAVSYLKERFEHLRRTRRWSKFPR